MTAAVMGGGSWGTIFAQVLCDAGTPAVLWCRRPEVADAINATRCNKDYLPDITLSASLRATADPAEAVAGADIVVLAVPSQTLRQNLLRWAGLIPPDALMVSLMKGIELDTCRRMSEVVAEAADWPGEQIAVVTGPNLGGRGRGSVVPSDGTAGETAGFEVSRSAMFSSASMSGAPD